MEDREKQYIKLRFGLSLKRILDRNRTISLENMKSGIDDPHLIKSFGKLATLSGIPKATIIRIVSGKINMASSTLAAIVDTLGMSLSEFGNYYDPLLEKDIQEHRRSIFDDEKNRSLKKTKKAKSKSNKKPKK